MAGFQLTAGQMKAIREVVQHYRNLIMGEVRAMMRVQQQASYYCKLDSDLDGATQANWNTASRPAAIGSVWHSDGADGLVDSGRNVTVVNRMGIAYLAGTVGWIEWRCAEWVFIGDCDLLPDAGSGSGSNLPPSSSNSGSLPSTSMSI